MSRIDFPNVPVAPGVPDIRRSGIGILSGPGAGILGAIQRYDIFGLTDSLFAATWGIFDKNGKAVLLPDSVVALDYRGESRISNYPVEQGSFASYNKVTLPSDLRVLLSCSGAGTMTRDQFIQRIDLLRQSLDLYDFVSSDVTYQNLNLERVDYRRQAQNGATLILADLSFREVRVTASASYTATAQASGAPEKSVGNVNAQTSTNAEQATYSAKDRIARLEEAVGKENVTVIQ